MPPEPARIPVPPSGKGALESEHENSMAKLPFVHQDFCQSESANTLLDAWHYVATAKNCQR